MDTETARLYENSVREERIPSYESFAKFVREQAKIIERTGNFTPSGNGKNTSSYSRVPVPMNIRPSEKNTRALVSSNASCPMCKGADHENFSRCEEFLKLSAKDRFNIVKKHNSCVLCLSFNHKPNACNIKGCCNNCQSKTHHTLLHFGRTQASTSMPVATADANLMMYTNEPLLSDVGYDELAIDNAGVSLCSLQDKTTQDTMPD